MICSDQEQYYMQTQKHCRGGRNSLTVPRNGRAVRGSTRVSQEAEGPGGNVGTGLYWGFWGTEQVRRLTGLGLASRDHFSGLGV